MSAMREPLRDQLRTARPSPLVDLARRAADRASRIISVLGQVPTATQAFEDIPRRQSRELGAYVETHSDHPALRPGKSVDLPAETLDEHADHWTVRLVRPRKLICWQPGCGQPATRQHESPVTNARPVQTCATCPPPGLRLVGRGDLS